MPLQPRTRRQAFARPFAFVTGAIFLATALSFGGRWSWACELLVNFRMHLAGLLLVSLVTALALRHRLIAAVAALGVALNAWPMYGAFFADALPSMPDARAVRVVEFNANIANRDRRGIAAYLDSLAADVVVLAEVPPSGADELADLLPALPHRYIAQRDGVWGVVIFSRWPLLAPEPFSQGRMRIAARVDVDLGDRTLRLYGAHLNWPVIPETAQIRNLQLEALGRELARCAHACVAVGDFNVTPWSSHFRDLLGNPGVRDCAAGRGLSNTWSSAIPAMLRIRIDQCVFAGAVRVAGLRVGESVGSDHFASITDLQVGPRVAESASAR